MTPAIVAAAIIAGALLLAAGVVAGQVRISERRIRRDVNRRRADDALDRVFTPPRRVQVPPVEFGRHAVETHEDTHFVRPVGDDK